MIRLLQLASSVQVTLDLDIALWILFVSFSIGYHLPGPTTTITTTPWGRTVPFQNGSPRNYGVEDEDLSVLPMEEDHHHPHTTEPPPAAVIQRMKEFPKGAQIGSHFNCWSFPDPNDFYIRGPRYFQDRVKIPSQDFLFPLRGVDLFLTDTCPRRIMEQQQQQQLDHSLFLEGQLRQKPTFCINFILPWGVLLFYFEIPQRFVPFLQQETNSNNTQEELIQQMSSPGDRTLARFLANNDAYKNQRLKIVPVVVDGPWIVRQVAGGKPAIVGTKMPIHYHYSPGTTGATTTTPPTPHSTDGNPPDPSWIAPCLEADLDIAASAAARSILAVARTYTNVLTIDLGFVIQANQEDELPEQMLGACRLHGIDPQKAPPFPDGASEEESL